MLETGDVSGITTSNTYNTKLHNMNNDSHYPSSLMGWICIECGCVTALPSRGKLGEKRLTRCFSSKCGGINALSQFREKTPKAAPVKRKPKKPEQTNGQIDKGIKRALIANGIYNSPSKEVRLHESKKTKRANLRIYEERMLNEEDRHWLV